MAIFNSFIFDEIDSLENGIYITGEAVYNAPERVVDMIEVPGKNGAIAIDQGRFENIEVTYPAGAFAPDQPGFASKIANFRNILASRYTYKRLEDTYNPDEFRIGLYRSGLEVEAAAYHQAGEFNIIFDCKPQRWLKSGEQPQTFTGGGGGISLYPYSDSTTTVNGITYTVASDGTITANGTATADSSFGIKRQNHSPYLMLEEKTYFISGCAPGGSTSTYFITATHGSGQEATNPQYAQDTGDGAMFTGIPNERTGIWLIVKAGTTLSNEVFVPALTQIDDALVNPTEFPSKPLLKVTGHGMLTVGTSTMIIANGSGDNQEIYIDCESQEAWELSGAGKISRNDYIQNAGEKFPELNAGDNAVICGDGITSVEITPRWWRI